MTSAQINGYGIHGSNEIRPLIVRVDVNGAALPWLRCSLLMSSAEQKQLQGNLYAALVSAGFSAPSGGVTIIVSAPLRDGPSTEGLTLAMALALLVATRQVRLPDRLRQPGALWAIDSTTAVGDVTPAGKICTPRRARRTVAAAARDGQARVLVPSDMLRDAAVIAPIGHLLAVGTLSDAADALADTSRNDRPAPERGYAPESDKLGWGFASAG